MTQPPGPQGAPSVKGGPISRGEIDARSHSWINEHVMYSQHAWHRNDFGSYRQDCSGYVSMCWNLDDDANTTTLPHLSHPIPREQLVFGDILLKEHQHVALFVAQGPDGMTVREAFDEGHPTVERHWSHQYASGFQAMRYNHVVDAPVPQPGPPQPGPPQPGPPQPGPGDFMTWGSDVRVHTKPSTESSVVQQLHGPTPVHVEFQVHGERITAEGITNDGWAWVPALNGFVSNIYIDVADDWLPGVAEGGPAPVPQPGPPQPGPPQPGPPQPGPGDFMTWGSDVRVHTKPSTESSVVQQLHGPTPVHVEFQVHGERITAEGITNDGWAWVPALNGFVSNIYIDVADDWLPGVAEGGPAPVPQPGPPQPHPPQPHPGPLPNVPGLNAEQVGNAKIIIDTGKKHGLPPQAWVIAIATALQESRLRNLDHGDKAGPDSCGLFQQRPTAGWGTREQCMNPVLASEAFYGYAAHTKNRGLVQIPGWDRLPVTVAAQRVQGSAFGNAYAQHEDEARELVRVLG